MPTPNLSVSQNKMLLPPEPSDETLSSSILECHQVEASRDFVNKVVRAAQAVNGLRCENTEIMKLAYRIEATQEMLEKLSQDGLTSLDGEKKIIQAIVDMGARFVACHKEVCRRASDQALSSRDTNIYS